MCVISDEVKSEFYELKKKKNVPSSSDEDDDDESIDMGCGYGLNARFLYTTKNR